MSLNICHFRGMLERAFCAGCTRLRPAVMQQDPSVVADGEMRGLQRAMMPEMCRLRYLALMKTSS